MNRVTKPAAGDVCERQEPLRQRYRILPEEAWIVDRAKTMQTDATDPFHGTVIAGTGCETEWRYGNHRAVGGFHDAPNPGDILSAALACCLESTTRMLAERMGVVIEELQATVESSVDVRGTLAVDRRVPVGFQQMRSRIQLRAAPGTDPRALERLVLGAERCCVILQTLRHGVDVTLEPRLEAQRGAA